MIEVKIRLVPFGLDYDNAELIGEVLIGNVGGTGRHASRGTYEFKARELTTDAFHRTDVPPFYSEVGDARLWVPRKGLVRDFPRLRHGALHLLTEGLVDLGFDRREEQLTEAGGG